MAFIPIKNNKAIMRILGIMILIIGLGEIIPWIYAEYSGETAAAHGFRISSPITIIMGAYMMGVRTGETRFRSREGYIVVALCWIIASIVGAIPYISTGFTHSYVDAFFESASGFTTTGCTAFATDMSTCKSILLWKALTHWLGGMGILLFVISLLPKLGINGQIIARAESPGPMMMKTTVRMSDSAKVLYITYFSFTIAEFILLMLSGKMNVYDAVITTLGSISTGGLLVHPEGIAFYDSLYIEIVISVFCLLAALNFSLYHYTITGKISYVLKDLELKAFVIIVLGATIICTLGLILINEEGWEISLRDASFQVISFATTAGYTRTPYITWPAVCQLVLLLLLFIGGCSASTAGSIKVVRVLVMLKMVGRGIKRRIHPRSVVDIKFGTSQVSASVVSGITVFVFTFMSIFLFSGLVVSLQGLDMETSFTTVICMLSNTGAAFGQGASIGNFSFFHPAIKIYLSLIMIVGRLELFTILMLFKRNFWIKQ